MVFQWLCLKTTQRGTGSSRCFQEKEISRRRGFNNCVYLSVTDGNAEYVISYPTGVGPRGRRKKKKERSKCPVSKLVWFIPSSENKRYVVIYYLLIHAKVQHVSLLWRCQLSKRQADVQHKYKLSGLSSAAESLSASHFYHHLCWHSKVWPKAIPYIARLDEKQALGGLVVFPVPSFFVYRILGILQRCDHKLAVLTKGDFEQSAFFFVVFF